MTGTDNDHLKTESLAWAIWKRVRGILAVDALLIVVVAIIGLILHWHALRDFGLGLMLAGVATWVFGGGSAMGSFQATGSIRYQYAQTVSPVSRDKRLRQDAKDREDGISFLFLALVAGGVAVALGLLLMMLGGVPG
jgi:hypothetical protein